MGGKLGIRARAPHKVILFGEHAVLRGSRCIAVAISKYGYLEVSGNNKQGLYVEDCEGNHMNLDMLAGNSLAGINATISLDVSLGCGLGTSAVVSQLLGYLKGLVNTNLDMLEEAHMIENCFHGISSGIDINTSYNGGVVTLKKDSIEKISSTSISKYKIIIYNTKVPKNTKESIKKINPEPWIYEGISEVAEKAYKLLQKDFELSDFYKLVRKNQDLLESLGICIPEMKTEILKMRQKGVECKITGAGFGGHLVALVNKGDTYPGWEEVEIDTKGFYIYRNKIKH